MEVKNYIAAVKKINAYPQIVIFILEYASVYVADLEEYE